MSLRPLISITVSFILGILLFVFAPALLFVCVALLIPTLLLFALRPRSSYGVFAICITTVLLGFWRMSLANHLPKNAISTFAPSVISVTGVLVSDVEAVEVKSRESSLRLHFRLAVESVQRKAFESSQSAEGMLEVYAYWMKGSPYPRPAYASKVRILGELKIPQGQSNPGGFDYAHYLKTQGIYATLTSKRLETLPHSSSGNPFLSMIFALRKHLIRSSEIHLSPEFSSVLNGILFGERNSIAGAVRDDFERTGTVHVLATAGLHVGIVAGLLLALFQGCRFSRRKAIFLTMGGLILYAFLAEGRPAVIRAVVIASVYLFARIVEREPDWWNAVAFAALILLILNPFSLMEAGFQLSFATVITLVLFMPSCLVWIRKIKKKIPDETRTQKAIRPILGYILTCFAVSFMAQAGTFPLIAVYFNSVSLTSVFANLMVVPLITPILALGFTSAFLGAIHPILSVPIVEMLKVLLKAVVIFVQFWGGVEGGVINTPSPPAWLVFAYYGVLWSVGWRYYRKSEGEETR